MTGVKIAHLSMQFSDGSDAVKHDVKKLFNQDFKIVTGTEAGPGGIVRTILWKGAIEAGYRIHFAHADTWVAVKKDFIKGDWHTDYIKVIGASEGVGKHGERGVVWVEFESVLNRKFVVGAGHYLTNGRRPGDPNFLLNRRHGPVFEKWVKGHGKGAVVIYNGDQNMNDEHLDTFFGAPLTSTWDKLKKWPNTGHGNIDVVASYDRNLGVDWKNTVVLNDDKFPLRTDHFLVVATADIKPHRKRRRLRTPTAYVARNLRRRGLKVYGHKRCLIFSSVYRNRRKTHPHHIIWNGDSDRGDDRVDTLWAHISVTHAFKVSMGSCMRTLHTIGMDRFGSGISYNFAIHHITGEIGIGQILDAKGTHTVMRVPRQGYSTDQNAVSVAIVFIGMPGMQPTKAAWESYEHLIAALIEEGFLTVGFDHNPHSFADPGKDCPTDVVRERLGELKAGGLKKVRHG